MRVLFLEPFYGGSHREFLDGWAQRSRHAIEPVTLPDRFWKWRLRGAALRLAETVTDPAAYDVLVAGSMLSLAELRGIWGASCPPALLYFHENQLTYPVPEGERRDIHFGFTNISSALAAERVLFNSHYHRSAFLKGAGRLLRAMPDCRPKAALTRIEERSAVLYPGCRLEGFSERPPASRRTTARPSGAPLIIWNHRWEFDKDPETFFRVLDRMLAEGAEFALALLGENFQVKPKPFLEARERYGPRILQYGYAPERGDYLAWLARGDIVISTAIQENFGIAMVEAMAAGCYPLLPRRLSYPEILPERFHSLCLYDNEQELEHKLLRLLERRELLLEAGEIPEAMRGYSWDAVIETYDAEIDRLASFSAM